MNLIREKEKNKENKTGIKDLHFEIIPPLLYENLTLGELMDHDLIWTSLSNFRGWHCYACYHKFIEEIESGVFKTTFEEKTHKKYNKKYWELKFNQELYLK